MLFSQRQGYKPIKAIIQIESIDEDLRNALWDALTFHYWNLEDYGDLDSLIKQIWHKYFKQPIDTIPDQWHRAYATLREYFFKSTWYEAYDFIEFISSNYGSSQAKCSCYERRLINNRFRSFCNDLFVQENSGYRFVEECITRITSEIEIESIEKAQNQKGKFKPVTIHLNSALQLLSDRKHPDYRNSIKESISAVESLCMIITNDGTATLGKALKIIEQKHGLHPALKGAYEKLYGYTSDADGIRHALLEEPNLGYEDALYMLVSCSAFINYLIVKTSL